MHSTVLPEGSTLTNEWRMVVASYPDAIDHFRWTFRELNEARRDNELPELTFEQFLTPLVRLDIVEMLAVQAEQSGPVRNPSWWRSPMAVTLDILGKTNVLDLYDWT